MSKASRQADKDLKSGFSLGLQDARNFLWNFEREPGALRHISTFYDWPGAFMVGYQRGRRKGKQSTLRVPKQVIAVKEQMAA